VGNCRYLDDAGWPSTRPLGLTNETAGSVPFRGISSINGGNSYCPNLAELGKHGINYLNAQTSKPSDSFPGLTAIVGLFHRSGISGGSPRTEGAYYDRHAAR
jgi:hypothetical protein